MRTAACLFLLLMAIQRESFDHDHIIVSRIKSIKRLIGFLRIDVLGVLYGVRPNEVIRLLYRQDSYECPPKWFPATKMAQPGFRLAKEV